MDETVADVDESNSIEASVESPTLPIDSAEPAKEEEECVASSDADVTPLNDDDMNITEMMVGCLQKKKKNRNFFIFFFIQFQCQGFILFHILNYGKIIYWRRLLTDLIAVLLINIKQFYTDL